MVNEKKKRKRIWRLREKVVRNGGIPTKRRRRGEGKMVIKKKRRRRI